MIKEFVSGTSQTEDALLQCLDAEMVCGKRHLQAAIQHAQRAFLRGNAISDTLAMEILIYSSGEVQISNALAKMGVKDGSEQIAFVMDQNIRVEDLLDFLKLTRDDSLLDCTEEKLIKFGIPKESIAAAGERTMPDLVLETVSMVDVKK